MRPVARHHVPGHVAQMMRESLGPQPDSVVVLPAEVRERDRGERVAARESVLVLPAEVQHGNKLSLVPNPGTSVGQQERHIIKICGSKTLQKCQQFSLFYKRCLIVHRANQDIRLKCSMP